MSIPDTTASGGTAADKQDLQDVLEFLATEEALGVTFVTDAIEGAPGTPSEAFLPVLRNGVTQEFHHVQALKEAGGTQLTTATGSRRGTRQRRRRPVLHARDRREHRDQPLPARCQRVRPRRRGLRARLCAEAMGTQAVPRALVRHAQNELGKDVGVPNDVGFENFYWKSLAAVRTALEGLGIGYGVETEQPGRFYDYPGRPGRQRRRDAG
jgi:hypothetical protein